MAYLWRALPVLAMAVLLLSSIMYPPTAFARLEPDAWGPISPLSAPTARGEHTAVWTGTEMLVWGGYSNAGDIIGSQADGARYNPTTDTWTPMSSQGAPSPRHHHTAVWTGTEMLIWGGIWQHGVSAELLATGARYNPTTDTWTPMSEVNAPSPRLRHTAVWTGTEMLVWGGEGPGALGDGARYEPSADTWTPLSQRESPAPRFDHTAVWTGGEMLVWGGMNLLTPFPGERNDGARYDPATDSWFSMSAIAGPTPREGHTALWTGTDMIIYGGHTFAQPASRNEAATGARYNPTTDTWAAIALAGAPHSPVGRGVWAGDEMLWWTGDALARYRAQADQWDWSVEPGAPGWRDTALVWAGDQLIIWGGLEAGIRFGRFLGDGARYGMR